MPNALDFNIEQKTIFLSRCCLGILKNKTYYGIMNHSKGAEYGSPSIATMMIMTDTVMNMNVTENSFVIT